MEKKTSRIKWLTTSELNTRFFHLTTIIRRRYANDFLKKQKRLRELVSSREEIGGGFVKFFEELTQFPEETENVIQPMVTREENVELTRIPTEEETPHLYIVKL